MNNVSLFKVFKDRFVEYSDVWQSIGCTTCGDGHYLMSEDSFHKLLQDIDNLELQYKGKQDA